MDPISKPNDSPMMSDEDDCSGDDDEQKAKGIGRRFCIERKHQQQEHQQKQHHQQMTPTGSRPKRARVDSDHHNMRVESNRRARTMVDYERSSGRSRRRACSDQRRQVITIQISKNNDQPVATNQVQQQDRHHQQQQQSQQPKSQTKGPVIFINPNFIKKFIEKSIELASTTTISSHQHHHHHNPSLAFHRNHDHSLHATNKAIANKMIGEIDFKTSSKESLQAASSMAIIRLVTECIEDDSKRDEKLNKTLAARLIDALIHHNAKPQSLPE